MVRSSPITLILGATGGIGSALVEELASDPGPDKIRIRAAVRRKDAAEALTRRGIETAWLDLDGVEREPVDRNEALGTALQGVDSVFLLTGYSVNMLVQSKAVVDAARVAGVKHIVHVGAFASADTTIVHLGWHQLIEQYIASTGLGFTHLHPNTFMQNIPNFSLRPGGEIHQFIGDAPVGWIDTADVARVAAAVLRSPATHRGRSYPLSVEALSIGQVAEIISDVVKKPFRYEARSPDEWFAGAVAGGMERIYAECVRNVFERTANRTLPGAADVFDNVEALTGRAPTRWREFAEKHRDVFLRHASS